MITSSMGRAVAAAFLLLAGCGHSYRSACEDVASCEGWNDADTDYCVADAEGDQAVAEAYDCGDQFADLTDCVESTGKCADSGYTTDCEHEEKALSDCKHDASAEDIDLS